ncbi:hypothetical protein AYK26_04095 [Euryarchaeota archaeon SM23-78]|nr:MAG: hypothetical protein AYK26_04095 [Euryarchaeota archaeon SM23-78]
MSKKLFVGIVLVVLVLPMFTSAATYYVGATGGDDNNDGLSQSNTWQTISKVNSREFNPGDKILFKRGETWREQLNVPTGGTEGNYVTYGAYGSGAKPRILGSEQITGWEVHSGNVWRASCSSYPGGGDDNGPVWFVNTNGDGKTKWSIKESSLGNVDAEYEWYWENGYLYVYSPTDPDSRYGSVEAAMRFHSIRSDWNTHYVAIENFEAAFTSRQSINDPYNADYWIVDSCYVHHSGCHGCPTNWASDNLKWEGEGWWIKNNVMHDGSAHNIQHFTGGATAGDIIEHNTFYNAGHASLDVKHVGPTETLENQIMRYNLIYMDSEYAWPTVSNTAISCRADMGYYLKNTQIYGNIIVDFWQWGLLLEAGVDGADVYNNVFYGRHPLATNPGAGPSSLFLTGWNLNPPRNVIIKNNIFAGDLRPNDQGIGVWYDNGLSMIDECDYNCYYITTGHYINADLGNQNDYYDTGNWEAWKTLSGFDTHSVWAQDPKFVNPSNFDFHLQSDSPCIDAGTNVGITEDFEGNPVPRGLAPDIGAFEYQTGGGYCGDGNCDSWETCSSCSQDCKCPTDCTCTSPQICCNEVCITPTCSQNSDCGSNPCKVYTCNNPGTCSSACSSQDITLCTNNDGCCPSGCIQGNDNDCSGQINPIALYHFDEGSGTMASDSSGNGNDGTINGATWTSNSILGNALEFDGANDYVDCGNNDLLNVDYVTVSMWFKANSFQDNAGLIAKGDNNNRQYWIWTYQNSLSTEIDEGGFTNYLYSLQAGTWYHLAITYDGSNIITYINGTEVNNIAQNTGVILTDDDPLLIGNIPGFQYFNGIIDEVRIYNRALTPEEILELYNQGIGNYIEGDLNNDGVVDISDLIIIATNFGLTSGFDIRADTNSNNEIDIFDIVFVASRFT